jgi:hypothetical protein
VGGELEAVCRESINDEAVCCGNLKAECCKMKEGRCIGYAPMAVCCGTRLHLAGDIKLREEKTANKTNREYVDACRIRSLIHEKMYMRSSSQFLGSFFIGSLHLKDG